MRERMMKKQFNKEKMEEHMKKMQEMMKIIPLELMSILRVQMMVSDLNRMNNVIS